VVFSKKNRGDSGSSSIKFFKKKNAWTLSKHGDAALAPDFASSFS